MSKLLNTILMMMLIVTVVCTIADVAALIVTILLVVDALLIGAFIKTMYDYDKETVFSRR